MNQINDEWKCYLVTWNLVIVLTAVRSRFCSSDFPRTICFENDNKTDWHWTAGTIFDFFRVYDNLHDTTEIIISNEIG